KRPKTPQFDSITATQSLDHFVEYRFDDLFYDALIKLRVLRGNALYEFRFYHGRRCPLLWSLVPTRIGPRKFAMRESSHLLSILKSQAHICWLIKAVPSFGKN